MKLVCVAILVGAAAELEETHTLFRGQRVWKEEGLTRVVQSNLDLVPLHLDEWAMFVEKNHVREANQPDAYWEFIPQYVGSVIPGKTDGVVEIDTPCFAKVKISATDPDETSGDFAKIIFESSDRASLECSDHYLLTTTESLHTEIVRPSILSNVHTVEWGNFSTLEAADVATDGFRVFLFSKGRAGTIASAFETALLFLQPQLMPTVSEATAERNVKFLKDYAYGSLSVHSWEKRNDSTPIIPDEDDVQDGDLFLITRLDGLDPMINWGTGGNSGHNVMALRIDGELYMVESQVQSAYWPKDFIQRNKYAEWISMAQAADYNVLYARLSAENAAKFDAPAAVEAFEQQYEGLLYGFPVLLWGWFDMATGNFPPPLDVHLVETIFSVLDPILTRLLSVPSLWNGAIAHRLGVPEAPTDQLLATARDQFNLTFSELLAMPEQDSWVYDLDDTLCNRTAGCSGPAQVCNVFVCKMWKSAGLFDVDFNCGEQTPLDTYMMDLFDTAPDLDPRCLAADPMNTQFCQIMGAYRMQLPYFSSVTPFTNMSESCPSQAPDYPDRFLPEVASSC